MQCSKLLVEPRPASAEWSAPPPPSFRMQQKNLRNKAIRKHPMRNQRLATTDNRRSDRQPRNTGPGKPLDGVHLRPLAIVE